MSQHRPVPGIFILEPNSDEQNPFVSARELRNDTTTRNRLASSRLASSSSSSRSFQPLSRSSSIHRNLPDYAEKHVPNEPHEYIDAALDADVNAVQQGLADALGRSEDDALWRVGRDESNDDDTSYFDHYPDTHPGYSSGSGNDDLTYEIPMITLDQPQQPGKPERPKLTLNTSDLNSLETGQFQERPPLGGQSPSKISGLFSRVSDRVAGSNNPPTPRLDRVSSPNDFLHPSPVQGSTTDLESTKHFATVTFDDNPSVLGSSLHPTASNAASIQSEPRSPLGGHPNISNPTLRRSNSPAGSGMGSGMAPVTHTAFPMFSSDKGLHKFDHLYLYGKTLRVFGPHSPIRIWCHRVSSHGWTTRTLLLLLFLQTVLLAQREWNPSNGGYYYKGYNWQDYILVAINIVYTVEIALKIVAYGLVDDKVLFDELGLDYPRSEFFLTVKNVFKDFRLFQWFAASKNRPHLAHTDSPNSISAKYDRFMLPNNHHRNDLPDDSDVALSETPAPKRNLRAQNTFLQSSTIRRKFDDMYLRRAFLRNNWQKIDFISMICFWISLPLSINHYDAKHHIFLFRALSCLRILRLCNLTTGTNIILRAIHSAIPQLMDVSVFIACFWVIFGIIGVQSFKSSMSRHCEWTNPNDPSDTYINSDLYCGSYLDLNGTARAFLNRDGLLSGNTKGYRCPVYSVCKSGENPHGGTVNFDNILQSMELVFVVMSANTFTDIMYNTMDSDNIGASLFYIFGIFILTVWLLNVFIAVIVTSFNIAQMEDAENKKRKAEGRSARLFFGWVSFDDELHNKKVIPLVHKRKSLRMYYRCELFFILVISAGVIVQCLREANMSEHRAHGLYRFEAAITAVMGFDILLRLALYYPHYKTFFLSRRNSVDTFLAVITAIIIIGPIKKKLGHAYYWLTIFQIARFYRVVLTFSVTRDLWLRLTNNIKAIFDLALFYYILLFLTSIILTRYFEGTLPKDEIEDTELGMYTLPNSFIALYVITTTENWTDMVYTLQEYAASVSLRSFGSIFLIAWFFASNIVILGIFIAVIARTLEVSEEGKRKQQLKQFIDDMTEKIQSVNSETGILTRLKQKIFKREDKNVEKAVTNLLLSGTAVNDFLEKDIEPEQTEDNEEMRELPRNPVQRWFRVNFSRVTSIFKNPFFSKATSETPLESFDPAQFARNVIADRNKLIHKQDRYLRENPSFNTVFYMLGPRHVLRRFCQRIVKSSHGERIDGVEPNKTVSDIFTALMFLSTIGIVITACYFTPLFRRSVEEKGNRNWTFYIDAIFIVIFTLELIIKLIADGLIFTPNAYMRSSWNWIDLIALISLWIELIAYLRNDGNMSRIVRGLKALRALRILTISETAKSNFHYTMISGFGKILNAAMISISLIFPFSIWGLNIFNGRLGYCLDGDSNKEDCFNEFGNKVFNWEVVLPNNYVEPYLHFNSFSSAFSGLYQIVSLEGWTDLLNNVMQSTGPGTPPSPYATPFNGFFVIFFNNISIVFILTLFVSVIIDNYSKVTGRAYLTRSQIQWYQVKKFLKQVKPSKRKEITSLHGFRRICYRLTVEKNKYWMGAMNIGLVAHVLVLLIESYPEIGGMDTGRYIVFMITTSLFLMNSLMLLIATGWKSLVVNKWDVVMAFVSFGAFVTTILSFPVDSTSVFINFNKLFLVAMLTFIFPRSNKLSQLLRFASASFPALLSLSFTWFVVFLMYAIAMNQVFGLTKTGPNTTGNINLRSVPKALILLFRCSFGEGWNYIMDDFALESPWCTADVSIDDSDCGSKPYAYILFMSWNVISMYIFLNLFVSLILDGFSYINSGSDYAHLISREEIRKFKKAWLKFDPEGTGFIRPYDLPKFLHSLTGALSFHFYTGVLSIPELCNQWIIRNNPHDPYDISVNYEEMNKMMSQMDVSKIQERRKLFETFVEEAIMSMEVHDEPGISFNRILLQIPLYNSFDPGQCLILLDFLDRRLFFQKLNKRMKTKRVYETIAAYACRWKYMENKRKGIRDTNIAFDAHRRHSYFAEPDEPEENAQKSSAEAHHVEITDSDSFTDDEAAPLTKDVDMKPRKSHDYVPKSPVHLLRGYKTFNEEPSPGLFIHILDADDDNKSMSHVSGHLPTLKSDLEELRSNLSVIDLSTIGETLEHSSWGNALRDFGLSRRPSNSSHEKSSPGLSPKR